MEEDGDGPVSGPVTMQKFNKRPKGQLRKKRADSDEEDAPAGAAGTAGSASAVVKRVKKVAEKKNSSLSFDTEEAGAVEEDAFASKKRAAGAKGGSLAFSKKDDREKGPAMGSYYNSGTSYSAEDLKELSKNARSIGGGSGQPASGAGMPGAGEAVPKKRKKEEPDVTVRMKGLPLAHTVKSEEPEEEEEVPSLVRGHRPGGANKVAADDLKSVMQAATSSGDGMVVPSDDQIARLKARREQARKLGAGTGGNMAKEFIPLENSMEEQSNSKSRLVRESVDDEEDMMVTDDIGADTARMTFGRGESDHQRKIAAMAAAEGAVMGDEESEDEEQQRRWEQQQVRQGRSAAMMRDEFGERQGVVAGSTGVGGLGRAKSLRSAAAHSRSMADVQSTLEAHMARMREQHQGDVEKLQNVTRRIESAHHALGKMEEEVAGAQKRYTFFQELRVYVQDVLECMDVKAPALEDLEEHLMEARRRRAEALRKRRMNDINDRVTYVRESVAKAAGRAPPHAQTQLDEFGRDPSLARDRRMKERQVRREKTLERRRETHRCGAGGPTSTAVEDMWTSDESEGEVAEYKKIRGELLREERQLMDDVKPDYKSVTVMYGRMLEWRKAFPKQYREAYVALSLPRLFAPSVRLEMMDWEPLTDGKSLEQMEWVTSLFQQQEMSREVGEPTSGADADDDELIPKIVEEVVVSKVKDVLNWSWDAGSSGSTGRAVGLMQDIVIYILDSAPEAVQALCGEVCAALSMELERYKAPLLVLAQEGDTPARDAFLLGKWAFLQCCKIVRNAAKWRDVVSPLALQNLTMDACTRGMLLPFLQTVRSIQPSDAAELSKMLLDSFPDEWHERPALQPFLAFYSSLR